jgi:glycosyltransferase involved in cell wall biosynthesis
MNSKPIRILHVVGGLDRGGVETWLMHVLRRTDRTQLQMDFLVPGRQMYAYEREAADLGAGIIRCLHPHNPLSYGTRLYKILSTTPSYDIVHSHVHFFSGFVLRIARLAGVAHRIVQSHTNTAVIDRNAGLVRRLQVKISKHWVDNSATRCLAVSAVAARSQFRGTKSEAECSILRCGVDLTPFGQEIDQTELRRELGLPSTAWVVGHVGRFHPAKNHRMLVQIAAEVARRDRKVHFVFIGDGDLRPEIEAMVQDAGCRDAVHFLGSRADVPRLLRCMDAFVFPSLYEGLALAVVEAQAAGLQCFVSEAVPREVEVVRDSLRWLALEDGPSNWAESIIRGIRSPDRCRNRKEALLAVELSDFNIEKSLDRLLAIYQAFVERNSPGNNLSISNQ